MNCLKFTIFSDLHYKKGMYASTTDDLKEIFGRAEKGNSDFVVHLGDLCNDYIGSPELVKAYLHNEQGLPVYGLYGNHELEGEGNSMEVVTPLLTNDSRVVWGTEDGKLQADIAYYYKDIDCFRFIFTDTNYSVNQDGEMEHNCTNSWGPRAGNSAHNSLSEKQFSWLREVLFDGADKGLRCIVFSHASFAEKFTYATDAQRVRDLLKEVNRYKAGTVVAAINGHWHANAYEIKDDILYFNINSAKNGCWLPVNEPHYLPEHTVPYIDFDSDGTETGRRVVPLNSLWMSPKTWFFEAPLSTQVTLYENGDIHIEGMKTRWVHDVVPVGEKVSPCRAPLISEVILKNE